MRLFIRVETTYVVTIDIPDTSKVIDLKYALWESKQTKVIVITCCVFHLMFTFNID